MNTPDYSTITYDKFLSALPHVARDKEWRYGQALFNLLAQVRPALAESIRATPLDPFYREQYDIDPSLWTLLETRWNESVSL